jgi:NrS-1  polymerase HBD domain/AAA domain
MTLNTEGVSLEVLKAERRWVLWRYEQKPGAKRPTKVPRQVDGTKARNDDPSTFYTFLECEAVAADFDGIGMELGCWPPYAPTPIVGVDGDDCVDADGKFTPEAREVVITLNSYSEFSPSKTGVHVWCLADLGGRKGIQRPYPGFKQVELKGNGFYHTFSNRHLSKTPQLILPRQAEIDALYLKVSRGVGLTLQVPADEAAKFNKLFTGDMSDYGDDHSRADLALCCILARRYQNNVFVIDREFRKSGLYREKWEREDYASATILKAVSANQVAFEPVALDDEDTPVEWIVEPLPGREEGWLPVGEVSLVGGPSGAGKTHSLIRIAENMRHGKPAFGHACVPRDYGILLHDRSRSAMRRTCIAANVSVEDVLSRVIRLTPEQQKARPAVILESAIVSRPSVKLWILEGLDFWIPDLHKLDAVGAVLDELQRVANCHRVAIVGTLGSPKQKENDRYASGRDQFMGSVAFGRKSETCIAIEITSDEDVRSMRIYPRNTKNERYWFTWDSTGLVETKEPAPVESQDDDYSHAVDLMELKCFTLYKQGDEVRYHKSLGPYTTFFRWRRVAEASGKVAKNGKKWYRTSVGLEVDIDPPEAD